MILTAVDTSVVVASLMTWHEAHERSLAAIAASTARNRRLVLPHPVLQQSYSVMTLLPPRYRLRPREAFDLLSDAFRETADLPARPGGIAWKTVEEGLAAGAVGGSIHDFEILEGAAAAGARSLLTLNPRDFRKFGPRGVDILEP